MNKENPSHISPETMFMVKDHIACQDVKCCFNATEINLPFKRQADS